MSVQKKDFAKILEWNLTVTASNLILFHWTYVNGNLFEITTWILFIKVVMIKIQRGWLEVESLVLPVSLYWKCASQRMKLFIASFIWKTIWKESTSAEVLHFWCARKLFKQLWRLEIRIFNHFHKWLQSWNIISYHIANL